MYTYILRKEPSVGFGEGEKVVEVVMVKPCIPSTQGRGGAGGCGGGTGEAVVFMWWYRQGEPRERLVFTSSWAAGRCGAG